jgi:phospholipid-binding lipoprotein MlaA
MQTSTRNFRASVLVLICALATVAGCSTAPIKKGEPIEPIFSADRVLIEGVTYAGEVWDPWEGFNRTIYRFNYRFDRYFFLPVVNAYKTVVPDPAERSIHNFFNNIRNIRTLYNSILQLSAEKTAQTLTRLIWNSTVGVLGLFDVASALDVPNPNEDFGQTLGYWGLGPGPYLVLPILGPSSVRDGTGLGVDWLAMSEIRNQTLDLETWQSLTWSGLDAIDTRAHVAFRYFETGSAFEYNLVRWLFTTKREIEIAR